MPGIISEVSQVRAVYRTITALSNVIAKGLIAHEALGWHSIAEAELIGGTTPSISPAVPAPTHEAQHGE